jgi:DNA-binding NarL/FixJ family response regulator
MLSYMQTGEDAAARAARLATEMKPHTVLLVEDSWVLAERIREMIDELPGLQLLGTAEDEQSAMSLLQKEPVDAVILDLQLKTGSGMTVLRKLSRMKHIPEILIVFTNYDLPEYRQQAAAMGVTHFLDKSRDYERLVEILRGMGRGDC